MRLWFCAALMALSSCAYVTRAEYQELWDADGDGWGIDEDCDDANPDVYPFAPDVRGDGCDADCGEEVDNDGDDWPATVDCDDNNADIFPCNPDEDETDSVDSDCDGQTQKRLTPCNDIEGWDWHLGADPDYSPVPNAAFDLEQRPLQPGVCEVQ